MKARLFFLFLAANVSIALANDSLVLRSLKRIAQLQPRESGVFPKGSIPSYRLYALSNDRLRADINAFYTGLVVFTLQELRQQFTAAQRTTADGIISEALPVFDKFRNRGDRGTYNFWPTDTPQIFPHAGWMNWFNKSQALPDDMDDTVILLMARQAPDSAATAIHALMQAYTNSGGKKIHNTYRSYSGIPAYSTWFGKKMPVDFDICVLANVLYFVQSYNLAWTAADSASLALMEKIIAEKKHSSAASYVSPHYNRLPVILYHLSRLMELKPMPSLEKYKPQLIEEALQAFASAPTFMDEVILSTALLRWGITPPQGRQWQAPDLTSLIEDEQFSFFIANMASILPGPLKRWMHTAGKFYYYAPAYNHALFLENLVWRKRRGLDRL